MRSAKPRPDLWARVIVDIFERYLHYLRRWWWLALLATAIGAVGSYWIASASPHPYRATATVLVSLGPTQTNVALDRLTATYEGLIAARPILSAVAARLGGPETAGELAGSVEVSAVAQTQLIRITAASDNPDRAALIASTLASVFIEESNTQSIQPWPATVALVEPAEPPATREGPSSTTRAAMGALAGACLALVVVMGRTYFDSSVWSAEDLGDLGSRVPLLGVLRRDDVHPPARFSQDSPLSSLTQPWRALGANVLSAVRKSNPDGACRTIAILSAARGEGRTTITSRLGLAVALEGYRVDLVDLDLRKPSLHKEFNLSNGSKLGRVVSRVNDWMQHEYVQDTGVEGLKVLAYAGSPSGLTGELSRNRLRILIERAKEEQTDFIFFDTPPLTEGVEGVMLGQFVDCAILVVEAKRTTVNQVAVLVAQIDAVGLPILGFVLNKR